MGEWETAPPRHTLLLSLYRLSPDLPEHRQIYSFHPHLISCPSQVHWRPKSRQVQEVSSEAEVPKGSRNCLMKEDGVGESFSPRGRERGENKYFGSLFCTYFAAWLLFHPLLIPPHSSKYS